MIERQGGRCLDCTRAFSGKLRPEIDHRPALENGGKNRESQIEAVCAQCHLARTRQDAGEKAKVDREIDKRLGIKRAPTRRPIPGSKASGWKLCYNRETGRWDAVRR